MANNSSDAINPGSPQVAAGRGEAHPPTKSPQWNSASTVEGRELRCIERLKSQRADVRRSLTLHEGLLIGDTRELGKSLEAELRKVESALTDKINDAYLRLRSARLLQQVRSEGFAAAIGGAP